MENPYAISGSFGDTIGGIANALTLAVVSWATVFALPREFKKARHDKALEAHANAASKIWMATFTFVTHLKALTNPMSVGTATFDEVQQRRLSSLSQPANEFISMMGLAELHFGGAELEALRALWLVRAELMVDVPQQLNTGDPDDFQRIYGGETLKKIEGLQDKVRTMLKPYAVPE